MVHIEESYSIFKGDFKLLHLTVSQILKLILKNGEILQTTHGIRIGS